jgi:hypothetical protein
VAVDGVEENPVEGVRAFKAADIPLAAVVVLTASAVVNV